MAWEIDPMRAAPNPFQFWARNATSKCRAAREWRLVRGDVLRRYGCAAPGRSGSAWEVDWAHAKNTGTHVWARNPRAHQAAAREWHRTPTGQLRKAGVNTPVYRTDSWEVDWSKRQEKRVWARNPASKMPTAREWHWIAFGTLQQAGVPWQPVREKTGRYVDTRGYVCLSRRAMSAADVALALEQRLFSGARGAFVKEHRLVALKKFGALPVGTVVRHKNGVKTDNSPDNLLLGTIQENTMDHETARLAAMYWRNRYEALAKAIEDGTAIRTLEEALKR